MVNMEGSRLRKYLLNRGFDVSKAETTSGFHCVDCELALLLNDDLLFLFLLFNRGCQFARISTSNRFSNAFRHGFFLNRGLLDAHWLNGDLRFAAATDFNNWNLNMYDVQRFRFLLLDLNERLNIGCLGSWLQSLGLGGGQLL